VLNGCETVTAHAANKNTSTVVEQQSVVVQVKSMYIQQCVNRV